MGLRGCVGAGLLAARPREAFLGAEAEWDLSRVSNEKDDGKGKGETQNTDEMNEAE